MFTDPLKTITEPQVRDLCLKCLLQILTRATLNACPEFFKQKSNLAKYSCWVRVFPSFINGRTSRGSTDSSVEHTHAHGWPSWLRFLARWVQQKDSVGGIFGEMTSPRCEHRHVWNVTQIIPTQKHLKRNHLFEGSMQTVEYSWRRKGSAVILMEFSNSSFF